MSRIQEVLNLKEAWFDTQWKTILKESKDTSCLLQYAETELEAAGWFKAGGMYGGELGKAVVELIKKFSDQEHSGMSAGIAINLFHRLSKYKPLTPLTGEDDEWTEVGTDVFQNKRCFSVFRRDGEAYNIDGIVWKDRENGSTYTDRESRIPVTFPYTVPDKPELRWSDTKELV